MYCAICNEKVYGNNLFCSDECRDKNLDYIIDQNYQPSNDERYDAQYELFIMEDA